MKIAYGIFYRLTVAAALLLQLVYTVDGITLNTSFVLLIFVVPELQLQWARHFASRPITTEKSPNAMLVMGILLAGVLLTADEHYTGVVPSLAVILGYVLFIKWGQTVRFDAAINKQIELPPEYRHYRHIYVLLGPSNPYDWVIHRAVSQREDVAILCANAGRWFSPRVHDNERAQQLIKSLGLSSYPKGGAARVDINDGVIVEVVREASRRVRPPVA